MKELLQKNYLVIMAGTMIFLSSCARKMNFAPSPFVPAAKGYVKIKKDKNNNNTVSVNLVNLEPADRLLPSRKHYVVWMFTEYNGVKNIGQLNPSTGLFSSKYKASLKTVTPFKPAGFSISAEDNPDLSYPGRQVVLTTAR